MLENDIILTRYLDALAGAIDEQDLITLERLLDMPDNELWDLLSGRAQAPDQALRHLVQQLRSA